MKKLNLKDLKNAIEQNTSIIERVSSEAIPGRSLIQMTAAALVAKSTFGSKTVIGCEAYGIDITSGKKGGIKTSGLGRVLAGEVIEAGKKLKALAGGYAGRLVDADLTGLLIIDDEAGGNFGNQPANDTVDVVSDDVGDTTQTVTVYGLENGGSITTEVYTLNGTTLQNGTKSFDRIYAVVLSAVCAGTITVTENSGGLTITTITTTNLSAGLVVPTDPRAFGVPPSVIASGASTKYVAIVGTDNAGAVQMKEAQLNGATAVVFADNFKTITMVLIGDVESARTVDLNVGAEEDEQRLIGISLEAASALSDIIDYSIR